MSDSLGPLLVTIKRHGEWLDNLALVLTGYIINKNGQVVEFEGLTTVIRPVYFEDLASADCYYQDIGGNYPIKIKLTGNNYFMDYTLANMIFDVADQCLSEVRDVLLDGCDKD